MPNQLAKVAHLLELYASRSISEEEESELYDLINDTGQGETVTSVLKMFQNQ